MAQFAQSSCSTRARLGRGVRRGPVQPARPVARRASSSVPASARPPASRIHRRWHGCWSAPGRTAHDPEHRHCSPSHARKRGGRAFDPRRRRLRRSAPARVTINPNRKRTAVCQLLFVTELGAAARAKMSAAAAARARAARRARTASSRSRRGTRGRTADSCRNPPRMRSGAR